MRLLVVVMGAVALCCALWSPAASAAGYDVHLCQGHADPQLTSIDDGSTNLQTTNLSQGCSGAIVQGVVNGGITTGDQRWVLSAPAGTVISSLTVHRTIPSGWFFFVNPGDAPLTWQVANAAGTVFDSYVAEGALPPAADITYPAANTSSITGKLLCPASHTCNTGSGSQVQITAPVAHMVDQVAPVVQAGGSLLSGAPQHGTQDVTFNANDIGAGLASVTMLIDGAVSGTFSDTNGGGCVQPYSAMVPCKPRLASSFSVDTTTLADGPHAVQLVAVDGAGQPGFTPATSFTVHNAASSTSPPRLAGTAQLGAQLATTSGRWDGLVSSFAYQWLRCPASVTAASGAASCTPVAGATDPQYAVVGADLGQRLMAEVTTSNFAGSLSAFSAPSAPVVAPPLVPPVIPPPVIPPPVVVPAPPGPAPDRAPPLLSRVSLASARFRAATTLRLTASEAGRLSLLIERARPGRKVKQGRKLVCKAVARPLKRGGCTLYARAATLTSTIKAGRSSVALSGKVGKRKLAPGAYRLTLTVRDAAGNVSKATRLSFTILPG